MSDENLATPKTNAAAVKYYDPWLCGDRELVPVAFARAQERQITQLRQDIARYENAHGILLSENKRLVDRVGSLDEALREAMEWNWCDDDMNEGVRAMCQRALGVTEQAPEVQK